MFTGGTIIKSTMTKRGFKHRREDDQFTIAGEYGRNLQYVYSQSYKTKQGTVIDLIYFAVDILNEKLIIGLYRENPDIENGVYENTSRSLSLHEFDEDHFETLLDKLISPVR